jgi:hypothetical protein
VKQRKYLVAGCSGAIGRLLPRSFYRSVILWNSLLPTGYLFYQRKKKAIIFRYIIFHYLIMLPTLTLKPFYHRGKENTGIVFSYNTDLSNSIKKIKDARWSQTHKCWYLPITRQHYDWLKEAVDKGYDR